MPCPIDFSTLVSKLFDFHKMTELPWSPLYSQSSGEDHPPSELSVTATHAMALTVLFTVFVFSLEHMLDERQARAYKSRTFPSLLEETVSKIDREDQDKKKTKGETNTTEDATAKDDAKDSTSSATTITATAGGKDKLDKDKPILPQLKDKFQKAQAYGRDKISFGMVSSFYGTTESVAFLLLGFLPYAWDASVQIGSSYFGWKDEQEHEIKISLIFLLLTTIVGMVTSLPFEIYSTFQIEKKHGFNKQTAGLFVTDKIKSFVLMCLIGGPFTAALLKIIKVSAVRFVVQKYSGMRAYCKGLKCVPLLCPNLVLVAHTNLCGWIHTFISCIYSGEENIFISTCGHSCLSLVPS